MPGKSPSETFWQTSIFTSDDEPAPTSAFTMESEFGFSSSAMHIPFCMYDDRAIPRTPIGVRLQLSRHFTKEKVLKNLHRAHRWLPFRRGSLLGESSGWDREQDRLTSRVA